MSDEEAGSDTVKGKVFALIVVGAIVIAIAAWLWSSRQSDSNIVEPPTDAPRATSAAGPVAPEAARAPNGDKKEDWFPDLSGANDIPGVTLGVGEGRTTFDCDVSALADKLGRSIEGEDGEARMIQYINTLSASSDAEHHLAALQILQAEGSGTVEGDEDSSLPQVDHLALALQADPMNPLVLFNAANACLEPDLYSICTDANLQANMRSVLGSNGEYWAQESARLYLMEDHDGALDALRRAASAPTFDNYFIENVRMHQRALSLVPDMGPIERSLGGYALSMMTVQNTSRGLAGCFFEVEDPSWFDTCTAVANRYASESPTVIQRGLGMQMLARLYEEGGQIEAAELERQRAAELTESFWIEDDDMIAVLVTDERVLSLYLQELEAGDELNAVQYLREEIERLKQDPTYTPCPDEAAED